MSLGSIPSMVTNEIEQALAEVGGFKEETVQPLSDKTKTFLAATRKLKPMT